MLNPSNEIGKKYFAKFLNLSVNMLPNTDTNRCVVGVINSYIVLVCSQKLLDLCWILLGCFRNFDVKCNLIVPIVL